MTKPKTDLKDPKDTTCALEKNKLIALYIVSSRKTGPGLLLGFSISHYWRTTNIP